MAEASDFKFGTELGFAKSNYKITPKDKNGRYSRLGASKNCGDFFVLAYFCNGCNYRIYIWYTAWVCQLSPSNQIKSNQITFTSDNTIHIMKLEKNKKTPYNSEYQIPEILKTNE